MNLTKSNGSKGSKGFGGSKGLSDISKTKLTQMSKSELVKLLLKISKVRSGSGNYKKKETELGKLSKKILIETLCVLKEKLNRKSDGKFKKTKRDKNIIQLKGGASSSNSRSELIVCSYNISGLPWPISSSSDPSSFCQVIGRIINNYDIALLQEDFFYHDKVSKEALHSYRTIPSYKSIFNLGDGLNVYSKLAIRKSLRVKWDSCYGVLNPLSGSDCLASKGFQFNIVEIPVGGDGDGSGIRSGSGMEQVHVYNLHMDAGIMEGDRKARKGQMEQLSGFLEKNSKGVALIIGGDTNLTKHKDDRETLEKFISVNGLSRIISKYNHTDLQADIDMIFYRSSPKISLRESESGVSDSLPQLSDHFPLWVKFSISTT